MVRTLFAPLASQIPGCGGRAMSQVRGESVKMGQAICPLLSSREDQRIPLFCEGYVPVGCVWHDGEKCTHSRGQETGPGRRVAGSRRDVE